LENLMQNFLGYGAEVFLDGFFEIDSIFGHLASAS
jgi:hypothetical protein